MLNYSKLMLLMLLTFCLAQARLANADTYTIQLNSNPPPMNSELEEYYPTILVGQILVGFNGADIGMGSGNGINENIGCSFEYPVLDDVSSATLIIELTAGNDPGIITDALLFADNNSPRGGPDGLAYGNTQLSELNSNESATIEFDLMNLEGLSGSGLSYDLTEYLLDGSFSVVYADDAFIHSMTLVITGTEAPVGVQQLTMGQMKAYFIEHE